MIDLAVGVIIGAAFGKIVTSLVEDLIMPLVGMLTGKVNFVDKFIVLANPKNLPLIRSRTPRRPERQSSPTATSSM